MTGYLSDAIEVLSGWVMLLGLALAAFGAALGGLAHARP